MRVLLVSDIHSNIEALNAVIEAAPPSDFDEVWCAGDVTGYGPNPNECVEFFSKLKNLKIVMGNHDAVISKVAAPLGFNPHAIKAALKNIEAISPSSQAWLSDIEQSVKINPGIVLVHGSPLDPDEYLLSLELAIPSLSALSKTGVKLCLFGHTHLPAMYVYDKAEDEYREEAIVADKNIDIDTTGDSFYLINPGSVGQPRDNDPRASYMELDITDGKIVIRNKRVFYKIATCQDKMRLKNYPEILINRLTFGY